MARRILNLTLCCLTAIALTSCSSKSPKSILEGGMSQFKDGKYEENYNFKNSGVLLDELIDKYSGSYFYPTGSTMSDDEHEDAKKEHQLPVGGDPNEPSNGEDSTNTGDIAPNDSVPEISNMTELMRLFHTAYDNTAEYVEFKAVNGFSMDYSVDLQAIYTQLQREDPIDVSGVAQWSTWNMGDDYYVSIIYSFDIDELKAMKSETVSLLSDAASKIDTDGLSEYEIVCAVNDYLCDTVYYPDAQPYEPVTHTAYGAFKDGCAVCEGYACAAKLMLNEFGIECDIEVGECLDGGGHAWNLVKLDGKWYQLDVTWNDQSNSREDYLLVTDEYMKQSRTWDESNYPVSAKSAYSS